MPKVDRRISHNTNSFITGSHAYGTPDESSDLDLVVRVDLITADKIKALAGGKVPIRFGGLNLILATTDAEWAVWKVGTETMRRIGKPIGKKEAKEILDRIREQVGIRDNADSGR